MKKLIILFIAAIICVRLASAQKTFTVPVDNSTKAALINEANNDTRGLKLSSPFGSATLSNFVSNISISSFFKEGVNGKIELQGKFSGRLSGGLSIDQKIGKSSTEATPLDLSGISPGTTVKFNLQKMFWKPSFDDLSDKGIDEIESITKNYASRKNLDYRTVGLKQVFDSGTVEEKRIAAERFGAAIKKPVLLNFELGFTKTSFSYATDSFTLKENNETFITPTISLSIVKVLSNKFRVNGYMSLSYNYSESYAAADDMTFTIPFGSSNNYYTSTISFGKPTKKTNHNIIAEYRKNIITKGSNSLAISPSVTLGINNKKLSLILPVYFIKGADEEGKLTSALQGGIRFGYITSTESGKVSSFKKGFTAQLIVSKPLNFLSKL